jgi:transposase InsO family protein
MGPTKWSYFYLYVILDIFSRRVVGWCVADAETAALFKPLLDDAIAKHNVPPGQLTLHADRGGPMKAKATALLLADPRVKPKDKPRRNPFAQPAAYLQRQSVLRKPLQDSEVSADLPPALWLHRGRQELLPTLLRLVQPGPSSRRDRPDDPGPSALRSDRRRPHRSSAHTRSCIPRKPGALRQQSANTTRQTNCSVDQSTTRNVNHPSLNRDPGCIKVVDTFRGQQAVEIGEFTTRWKGRYFRAAVKIGGVVR